MKKIQRNISFLLLTMIMGLPLITLLSCKKNEKPSFSFPDIKNAKAINLEEVSLLKLKEKAIAEGITKSDIDSLTIADLQNFRLKDTDKLDQNKKDLIEKINKLFVKFVFDNNKNRDVMLELQKWLNNAGLAIYSSQSPKSRGPWRTQISDGDSKYYRNDFLNLRSSISLGSIDLVGSSFKDGTDFNPKRFIRTFNTVPKPTKGERKFDNTMLKKNNFSWTTGSANSFAIYRSRVSGDYEYNLDSNNKKIWTAEEKDSTNLFGGLNIQINDLVPSDTSYKKAVEIAKSEPIDTKIVFKTSNKPVNYGKAKNGEVVDSTVAFKAKDIFYGFIRNLYASKQVRENGIVNGIDINAYVNKFTNDQKQKWINLFQNKAAADAYDRENTYLYDLYGLDILETIKANIDSSNENEVIFKFNNFNSSSLEMFRDNSLINPFSKTLLDLTNVSKIEHFTPKMLSVFSYGNPYSGKGEINTDGILSLAPFIYTRYSISARDFQHLKQNPYYFDQTWVNDPNSIKCFSIENKPNGVDASAFAQQRLVAFKDAARTEEYILDGSILNNSTLLKDIRKYKVYKKPVSKGLTGASRMTWNFYGFNDKGYNELGKKMMWGFSQNNDITSKDEALYNFFSGNGANTRASINSAINWYAMAQILFPKQNKEFYPGIAYEDEFKISNLEPSNAIPSYMSSIKDMKQIYDSNINDRFKAWTPKTVFSAAKTLDKIATDVGATNESPAKIGIFRYIFNDSPGSSQEIESNKLLLERLNTLTPKVKFVNQDKYSWSDFIAYGWRNYRAATQLSWFSPDYSGIGSINQKFISESYAVFGLFKEAFSS